MNTFKLSLAAAAAVLALSGVAHAEDRPLGLVFNVGAATDYSFRGVSNTNNKAEGFAGADVTIAKIGYAGTWISNVDFGDSTKMEYDLYAGIKPVVGPVSFDFGAIRYGYTNAPSHADWDYYEIKGLASIAVGKATLGGAVYWTPDVTGPSKANGTYFEVNGAMPIPDSKFSVSGAFGRQTIQGPGDYNTWNAGVTYQVTDTVSLDARYIDTSEHKFGKIYEPKAVATVKVNF